MNKQQLASKVTGICQQDALSKNRSQRVQGLHSWVAYFINLSDKEVKWLKENDWTDEYLPDFNEHDVENAGYRSEEMSATLIAYENQFSTWSDMTLRLMT